MNLCLGLYAKKIDLRPLSPNPNLTLPNETTLTANGSVLTDIKKAEKNIDKLVGAHDLCVLRYDGYGKDFIRQLKTSPDGWAEQMDRGL